MKKYGKVLLSVFGSCIVSGALLAVTSGDGFDAFGGPIVRAVTWDYTDFSLLDSESGWTAHTNHSAGHQEHVCDDDDGDGEAEMLERLLGALMQADIRDVYAAGVNTLIQTYETTVDGLGIVHFGRISETWLFEFMRIVRFRLGIEGAEGADWVMVHDAMQRLADEVNAALAGG